MGFSGPLYDQVHRHLRDRILAGEWEDRQPLPPEVMLSQELGVSVGTVRKAMEKLMQEKIVVRERGRGTFVRRGSSQRAISTLTLRDLDGKSIEAEISLTRHSFGRVSGRAARLLAPRLGPTATLPVITFERDWHVDDLVICRETIVAQQYAFPNLAKKSSEQSGDALLATYLEQIRMQAQCVRWDIGMQPRLTGAEAPDGLLPSSAVLTRYASNAGGEVLEICEHLISLTSHTFEIIQ
jgi:DNA-binding GntR family transcriptional regulator